MAINLNKVSLRVSAGTPKQFPADPVPQIAFSGRSNVGKSSLINLLLGRKSMARVSSAPGKTITVNFYDLDGKLFLVDLPGYGFAKRTKEDQARWSGLTDGYFTANRNADRIKAVVQLVDSRIGPTKDDLDMLAVGRISGVVAVDGGREDDQRRHQVIERHRRGNLRLGRKPLRIDHAGIHVVNMVRIQLRVRQADGTAVHDMAVHLQEGVLVVPADAPHFGPAGRVPSAGGERAGQFADLGGAVRKGVRRERALCRGGKGRHVSQGF